VTSHEATQERPAALPAIGRLTNDPPALALAGLLVVGFVVLMLAGRHLTFFYDEWDLILRRRGGSVGSYLDPHNGHIVLFEVLIYKALLATVGLRHYWPYQAINALLHLACVSLVFVLARRRTGGWTALALAALLLFMGSASQDLLWPFQIGWFDSVAGGLGALALLERPSARRDLGAMCLLITSLSGSAVGIAFLVAAFVLVLCDAGRWRRLWLIVVPAVLFLIWYKVWGTSQPITSAAVLGAPQYVATASSATAAGLLGLDTATWGPPVLIALIAVLVLGLQGRRAEPFPRLALAAAIGALAFWLLISLSRATEGQPDSSRYLYIGAVFLLLLSAEARLGAGLRGPALGAVLVLVLGAIVGNLGQLRTNERSWRAVDTQVRASLTAVQIAAPIVPAGYQPDPTGAPQITAGPYLAAERSIGSPAYTSSQLEGAPASAQAEAEAVLAGAESIAPASIPRLPVVSVRQPLTVEAAYGGHARRVSSCVRLAPTGGATGSLDVEADDGDTLAVRTGTAAALVYLRRFAPSFTGSPLATLAAGSVQQLRFPRDIAASLPWHVQIVSMAAVEVCATH
jgi:hypothetical protein